MISTIKYISTPRLLIRKYERSDAQALAEGVTETLDSLLPWMPWAEREPLDETQRIGLIESWNDNWNKEEDFVFGIFSNNGEFTGSTGLHPRLGPGVLETGYWIRKKYQGMGFASEAAYAMTIAGLKFGGIGKMVIRCDPANTKSARVPARIGYSARGEVYSEMFKTMYLHFEMERSNFLDIKEFEPVRIISTS